MLRVFLIKCTGPFADALQNGNNRDTFFREGILHTGRYLIVGLSCNDVVGNQPFQRGCQHRIGDIAHFLSDLAVAQHFLGCQNADDPGIPFAAENFQPVFQRTADVFFADT